MLNNLKRQDIFIALIVCGAFILIAIKIKNDDRELKRNFVKSCADYNVRRIQNTCRNLGIGGFEEREQELTLAFTSYCACLIDVWNEAGIPLQPEYFLNASLPASTHTEQTKQILSWVRSARARSGHATCQANAKLNLNWIPAAINQKKQKKLGPITR